MPWQARLTDPPRLVELTYSGIVTPEELFEAFTAALSIARENKIWLCLADCTDMVGGHSIADLYALIALFEVSDIDRNGKEAILMPTLKASRREVTFYETTCRNRGFHVRVFKSRKDAVDWLVPHSRPS
jgi:hypothetical protein